MRVTMTGSAGATLPLSGPPRVTAADGAVLLRSAGTPKGVLNQRRVLTRRAALVDVLYAGPAPAGVIIAAGTAS
jgi:hypothetical protein